MRRMIPLLLCCLLLTGCADPLANMAAAPLSGSADVPVPVADETLTSAETATLWFRFGQEPFLAQEQRTLSRTPTESYEFTLLSALLSGPSGMSQELSGLYPPGTRVTAAHRQGRLLFVTLSRQIMNDYPDEAGLTREEAALRRVLAMQAIAATVTENCGADEVIILVEQGAQVTDSMRLRQRYYDASAPQSALADPLRRDESLLLTPSNTARAILTAWSDRDWSRLYRYIARRDPENGQERPDEADCLPLFAALPHLTEWTVSSGSVDASGQRATLVFTGNFLSGGQESPVSGVLLLYRERGVWRVGLSQLIDRGEALP